MEKEIIIIGVGIAGLSIARDMRLRDFRVTILEKNTVASGTTRCAAMLHSGARYAVKDKKLAELCFEENKIINHIADFAIGKNKGLFISMPTDDQEFHEEFERNCLEIGIPIEKLNFEEIEKIQPGINKKVSGGYLTPDLVIDNSKLIDAYVYNLKKDSVDILERTEILRAEFHNNYWNLLISQNNIKKNIRTNFVINASGSNLSEVAKIFGDNFELSYIHGAMAILNKNICNRIISRCAPSTSGDTIIPSAEGSLIGSTWHESDNNNPIMMSEDDREELLKSASLILEETSHLKIVSNIIGIRTHVKADSESGSFNIKRDYAIVDHNKSKKVSNFISVLPGKLTLSRFVAEKVGDIICKSFNLDTKSKTKYTPLSIPTNYSLNK